jgi:hypothetical protein
MAAARSNLALCGAVRARQRPLRRFIAAARQKIPSSNDVCRVSAIRPNSDPRIRKLLTERVASRAGVAGMFVEFNDEQRRDWFLSYFRQIVARPDRYGRATTCRLSATFLP